ncbi:MAG: cobyric acid synthase [Chloroflexota bacterium]
MLLGTHSNAGKSLLATAFCRILARRGIRVAPFKAQNMSNNAGVTPEGGEMGRAQLVQAEAAGISPHTDMNPVLLKPEANRRSQIILNGKVAGHIEAKNWFDIKKMLWEEVKVAYDRLAGQFDVIVMEGAGSPAEINLKQGDIVNLPMARHANAPCLLVGDIDRGGVFAALAGTMLLLDPAERTQVKGFLINKFRGDPALLGNATTLLQERAFGVPTLGIIPYLPDLQIADEDAVVLQKDAPAFVTQNPNHLSSTNSNIDIVVIHLPHIANFDEFDALKAEPGVQVRFVASAAELGTPHAILIPGSKVTLADLAWMRERKLDMPILAAAAQGVVVVGICGGYQILGRTLADPFGMEGPPNKHVGGLGLLPVYTELNQSKQTHQAQLRLRHGEIVHGYEIHVGDTTYFDSIEPFGTIIRRGSQPVEIADGASTNDGKIWGTYLHGIFENDEFRRNWLQSLGWEGTPYSMQQIREQEYDRLADAVEERIGWPVIEALIKENQ